MRILQLVMAGVWGIFALALILVTIADFSWITLLMGIGCSGAAITSFMQYKWYNESW